ncbi:MAG: FAD-dependent oxidoreductase [Alphaproteobacteria bacterium]|nr:FAD-dependent oxidoreductase [Alphaproteobacteria bacterium]
MPAQFEGSYYEATVRRERERAPLKGDQRFDVSVIGGGYTGLSTALHLRARGLRVAVLERKRIGAGASGRNGGQVITGQRVDQDVLEQKFGEDRARTLWNLAQDAKSLVRSLIADHAIACDLTPGHVTAAAKRSHARHLAAYAEFLTNRYAYSSGRFVSQDEMRSLVACDGCFGGYHDADAFHINPLAYAYGLAAAAEAAGSTIYENSRVIGIDRGKRLRIATGGGSIDCDFAVVACNGYLDDLVPDVAGHILPISNYVIATEPLDDARAKALIPSRAAVADTKFVLDYYRLSPDNRLIFGGGETYGNAPADIGEFVRPYVERVFPQLKGVGIDHAWQGTLAITLPRLPHVGRIAPNLFFAQGYSGHGVAIATHMGKLLADAIAGNDENFAVYEHLNVPKLPGGSLLRRPLLTLGMTWYALRDRLP